jgi:tRNA modification GTPase
LSGNLPDNSVESINAQATSGETIVACASAFGRAGVSVVRLSGTAALDIGCQVAGIANPKSLEARKAYFKKFSNAQNQQVDEGLFIYFAAPNSFTGEDVVELQGHGGQVVIQMLIKACVSFGARLAKPGEFSERAFLNDKIDLSQAEAIADLVDSSSEQAARSALRSMQGVFSEKIDALSDAILKLRIYVEAAIDFPEEEIDFLSDGHVESSIDELRAQIQTLSESAKRGILLNSGVRMVLLGKPNAGKSSLLNLLAQQDRAIVTHEPGTTRDVLNERIEIDGLVAEILDTAGIRETSNVIEKEGIKRALEASRSADIILHVVDINSSDSEDIAVEVPKGAALIRVVNKIDTQSKAPSLEFLEGVAEVRMSAKEGVGLDLLIEAIKQSVGFEAEVEAPFIARQRHLDALAVASAHVESGYVLLTRGGAGELLAEELRLAQDALGEILGKMTADAFLGHIFSSFCIGK